MNRLKDLLKREKIFYLSGDEKIVIDDRKIRFFDKIEEEYVTESKKKLKGILNKYQGDDYTYVASAEEYSGDPFEGFRNAHWISKNLKKIVDGFGLDVKIIVYLRRQDDFIQSLYTQSIFLGESHSFQEFLSSFDETCFDWKYLVDSYANDFGEDNIIVRRYHKKFLPFKNSLMQDFGRVIGSQTVSEFEETRSKNRGFSRDALEIMRLVNKELDEERYQLRKIFRESNAKNPFSDFSYFKESQRKEFYARYETSNKLVAEKYLNPPEEKLFPEPDKAASDQVYPGLTLEAVTINFTKALLRVQKIAKEDHLKLARISRNRHLRHKLKNFLSRIWRKFQN